MRVCPAVDLYDSVLLRHCYCDMGRSEHGIDSANVVAINRNKWRVVRW